MSISPALDVDIRVAIGAYFSKNAIENGMRYARQNRVAKVEIDYDTGVDALIVASVRGSDPKPYTVRLEIAIEDAFGDEVVSHCSCPIENNCKHGVAAFAAACVSDARLLELFDQTNQSSEELLEDIFRLSGRNPMAPKLTRLPKPQLDWEMTNWLDSLQEPNEKTPKEASTERALFLRLHVHNSHGEAGAAAELRHHKRLKSGEWNAGQRFELTSNANSVIASLNEREQRILALLRGDHSLMTSYQGFLLRGRLGALILREALEAQRLCAGDQRTPLASGDKRVARLAWNPFDDGSHRTALIVDPPATLVLPLDPPCYVDVETNTCGPLEIPVAPSLIEKWLAAPPVQAGLDRDVAKKLEPLQLPAPPRVEVVSRNDVHPVPVLRLQAHLANHWQIPPRWKMGINASLPIGVATLGFDYLGKRSHPGFSSPFLEVFREGRLERIARHPQLETAHYKVIESALVPMDHQKAQFHFSHNDTPMWAHFVLPAVDQPAKLAEGWMAFVDNVVPGLVQKGWRVEFDDSFPFRIARVQEWFSDAAPAEGQDWFDLELGVVVDGQRINLLPILSAVLRDMSEKDVAINAKAIYAISMDDGRQLKIDGARLALIRDTFRELLDPDALSPDGKLRTGKLQAADAAQVLGTSNARWLGSPELRELGRRIRQFDHVAPVAAPSGFAATLRPYQQDGLAWLQFLREYQLAGILADDMGLGKTVQALAHLAEEKRAGRADRPSLVVAPTSLMANWRREAERFAPELRVLVLHGAGRKSQFDQLPKADLVVTSYPLLPRDEEILIKQPFHLVILDEAQYIKNPKAAWSQVAGKLQGRHRVAMTGTPMENHLGELWSIMNFLMPGYLGDERQFRRIFRTPIEKHQDTACRTALQRRLRPFLLRRKKEQVAAELPPKTEILRSVDLEGGQRDLYETVRSIMQEKVRQEIAKKGVARSHIVILDALLKLRQVCCDPRLVKLDAARKVTESAKLELLMDLLPDLLAEGRRILLFSQFTSMLALVRERLDAEKIPYVVLTGETTDRDTPVQRFQAGEIPLFLISLKAGGTGLNLTAADTVIHYDPWWNPAVEAQATDRAHRIGQDKKVFVYKIATAGTVEEKILALQERKKQLLAGVLGEETAVSKLSAEDLTELFAPLE